MNGIEKIIARINGDAQGEIDATLSEARAQAAEITARFEAQARAEADEILARGAKLASEREERLVSVAQLECRKATLAAKQEVIEEAFELAMKKLLELPQDKYVTLLGNLAARASVTGKEELSFGARDAGIVAKAVAGAANNVKPGLALTATDRVCPINGGFILSSGSVEVNCSFETLMRLQRSEITGEVSGVLFR